MFQDLTSYLYSIASQLCFKFPAIIFTADRSIQLFCLPYRRWRTAHPHHLMNLLSHRFVLLGGLVLASFLVYHEAKSETRSLLTTISPATKTLAIYEINQNPYTGTKYWKGNRGYPINLTQYPILESDIQNDLANNGLYELNPAIKHTSDGLILLNVAFKIRIKSDLNIKISESHPGWDLETVNGYTECATIIPQVIHNKLTATPRELVFHRSGHESFDIVYRISGTDSRGWSVGPIDTTVKLSGLEN